MDFGSNVFNEILDYLPGRKWKTVRQMLTPMLTTSKLKLMSQVINESATEFAEDLKNECVDGKVKIDCRRRMTTWLIDMFTRATLGVQMGNAKDPENEFAVAFRTFMGEDTVFDWIYSLSLTFPFLTKFAPTFDNEPTNFIERIFRQILHSRRSTGEKKNSDFVDILNELIDRTKTNEYKELQITEDTIISQAVNFFLGGYETSGTTSTVLLYYLARNPNVQRNLQLEIDSIYEKTKGNIDHDAIREEETPYLTACINESLRLGPPLYRPERVCTKNWSYGNIKIKRTTTIFLCLWALHRDESYFDDPDEFKPERFLPENKDRMNQYAFVPFGLGQRACIGIRFAYESLKLLFIHLVRNFEVKMREDTNLQYKPGQQVVVAFKPLYLDLVNRKQ
ncbi:cytochrome P450 3A12-like isoform X2 [Bradysia coprophila]|nr:cytochrome P450 3A12-like isoform X2 [Bradysia coprophila]